MLEETKLPYARHPEMDRSLQALKAVLDAAAGGPEALVSVRDAVAGSVLPPLTVGLDLEPVRFQFLPSSDGRLATLSGVKWCVVSG